MKNQKKSTKQQILDYLKSGGKLTTITAQHLFKTTELRSRIAELRKEGHIIKSRALGNDEHFTYWMESAQKPKKSFMGWLGSFNLGLKTA